MEIVVRSRTAWLLLMASGWSLCACAIIPQNAPINYWNQGVSQYWSRSGLSPVDAVAWARAGFTPEDARAWGDTTTYRRIDNALAWAQAKYSPSEARQWIEAGILDPAEADSWQIMDNSDARHAGEYRSAGLTPDQVLPYLQAGLKFSDTAALLKTKSLVEKNVDIAKAIYYVKNGIEYQYIAKFEQNKKDYAEHLRAILADCDGKIGTFMELAVASPYIVFGHCYEIPASAVSQWLGPSSALVLNYSLLIDSDQPLRTGMVGSAIVRGEEPFIYTNGLNMTRTVHRVLVLMWTQALSGGGVAAVSPTAAIPAPAAKRTPEMAMQEGSAALAWRDYAAAEAAARDVLNNNKTSPRVYDAQLLLAQALAGRKQFSQAAIAFDDTYKLSRKGAHAQDALLRWSRR